MILIRRVCLTTATLASALLTACTSPFPNFEASPLLRDSPPRPAQDTNWQDAQAQQMPAAVRAAVNKLISRVPDAYRSDPVLVGTVVDANQVGSSAALGRMLSEQLQAGMVASGFGVVEMRLREAVAIRETSGELMLSRDVQDLAKTQQASLVVLGTYTAAETVTFIHFKAIRAGDGVIESTAELTIPNDANVRKLLGRY